jgi:hypothetical protein
VKPRRLDTSLLRFIDDGGDELDDQTAYTAYNSWTDDEVDMSNNYIKQMVYSQASASTRDGSPLHDGDSSDDDIQDD